MLRRIVFYFGVAFLIGLGQKFFLDRLMLYGAAPDAVLIWLVFLARREGQSLGTTLGFFIGLMMDLLHGTLGIDAFSKTVAGFSAGFFRERDSPLGQREFFTAVAVASAVGTVAFYLVSFGLAMQWWQYGLAAVMSVGYNLLLGYVAQTLILRRL